VTTGYGRGAIGTENRTNSAKVRQGKRDGYYRSTLVREEIGGEIPEWKIARRREEGTRWDR
jgi:hypothetical protein